MHEPICIEVFVDQEPQGMHVWKKSFLTTEEHTQTVIPGDYAKQPPDDKERCANTDRDLRCCWHGQISVRPNAQGKRRRKERSD